MALVEENVNGNCTVLPNGCILVQRITRIRKNGENISEKISLDIISPDDDISGEDENIRALALAAREAAKGSLYGGVDYRSMIRRRAKRLEAEGKFYEAILLLKTIGE